MIGWKWRDDRGQAFPLYAVFIVMLLFAALAFFTIGKAALVRSDAQGAADAAALAAARESRDHLMPGLDLTALTPEVWGKILQGDRFATGGCGAANDFAARNDATAACRQDGLRFVVEVKTNSTVGDSVVPGVSGQHGTANATAEIIPRCRLGSGGDGGSGADETPEPAGPVEFKCDSGVVVKFDPAHSNLWTSVSRALFDIRLID
ncbi:pilus assembly protein TadG-related protein [Streptomyces sp. NPDC101733]|uniref:pilus assembly protein TadG-related protein n=1 Tax=unclassified Streptomyces TaxID=2593676 RepID=UPI00380F2F45